ncbi:MAG: diguanylate cyclase [Gammaproteobacteria bacterium]|nr:diguanylate cyclase [Gammaproteobacteria bacterium]
MNKECGVIHLFFVVLTLGCISLDAVAESQYELNSIYANGFVRPPLEILIDEAQDLSIEQVVSTPIASGFTKLATEQRHLGFTGQVVWLRVGLDGIQSGDKPILLEMNYPLIDRITLFDLTGDTYRSRSAGDRVPFKRRDLQFRNPVFVLDPATLSSKMLYLRLETEGSMPLDLRLWSPVAFAEYLGFSQLWFGAYYGLIFVLALTALAFFFYLRSSLFLTYSLFLGSFLLLQMVLNGFAFQYLWPNQTWWATHSVVPLISAILVFGLFFSGRFLGVWGGIGWIKRSFQVQILLTLPIIYIGLAIDYRYGVILIIGLSMIVLISIALAAVTASFRGLKPARPFLFAYGFFLIGALFSCLTYLGLIPYHFLSINAIQVGSVFVVLILSLAMADRMQALRQAKDDAQSKAAHYMHQLNTELEHLVESRTQALVNSNRLLKEQTMRDSLTGTLNHRAILERLEEELEAAKRYKNPIAAVMLDLDFFKQLNDRYGHQAGDSMLIKVARLLEKSMRKSDHCGRYGGEEFLVILSHVSRLQAMEWAERIRRQIAATTLNGTQESGCTCSLGVAVYLPDQETAITAEKLINLADRLLYKSKHEGRNRVSIAVTRDAERYGIDLVGRNAIDPAS